MWTYQGINRERKGVEVGVSEISMRTPLGHKKLHIYIARINIQTMEKLGIRTGKARCWKHLGNFIQESGAPKTWS